MTTQTLEFNCTSGLTLTCKLFAVGSDTVAGTQSASEKTNHKNRYTVDFEDLDAGAYQLTAFVGSVGGFANEIYDIEATGGTYLPRSEKATTVSVLPFTGSVPDRTSGTTITVFNEEAVDVTVTLDGASLVGKTLEFIVEDADRNDLLIIANGSITRTTETFTVSIPLSLTLNTANHRWSLRDITGGGDEVIGFGVFAIVYAPSNDG